MIQLIPKWSNFVKDVLDSEDIPLNIYREILQQNMIFRVTKMNSVKKYLEILAEIAELNDDYKKFCEFGKRMKLRIHKSSVDGVEVAELLRSNTCTPGDERINFKECVDRMKEGQNDIYGITGKNIAVVSSSLLRENLRKKGYEVPYMADPVDELAVQQPKESDGMKLKSTTKEGVDLGDQNEKKSLEELKIEPEPLRKLMKETLGNKAEEVIVNDRIADYLRVFTLSERDLPVDMKRAMKAQAPRDNSRHPASEYGGSANMRRTIQQRDSSQQQQQDNQPREARQSTRQERGGERKKEEKGEGERGRSEQEEKGREERESARKGERGKEEGRNAEEDECKQVEKDAMDWTVVTRNKRQNKMAQIFVKVNGSKATPMEVNLTDGKVEDVMSQIQKNEDVYVTMYGKVLRRNEKLKSCGVSDGCTIQVTSRLQGGGKHKEKKSKVKKKQVTREGPVRNEGPVVLESNKEAVIRILEENEGYRKIVKMISEGSDEEYGMQCFRAEFREKSGLDANQMKVLECGIRWAVEARREGRSKEQAQRRQGEQGQDARQEQSKQGKQVRFGDDEQFEETRTESADDGLAELRTGRGSAGLVRGGDERFWADETSRKGKGKGNGGKGEHEGKGGGFGRNGKQQETGEEKEERDRMAPNMGAGGSHPQAMSDPGEEEVAQGEQHCNEEKEEILRLLREWQEKETSPIVRWALTNESTEEESNQEKTQRTRWADCEDDEEKEEEEQETGREGQEEVERKKGQETEGEEKEVRQETGQEELTSEKPPGLEASEESEHEVKEEEERSEQEAREEQRRAQEAREEERSEQEAREEQRRAQEAREEERRAQEAREEERSEQEAREEQRRAQEAQGEEKRAQDAQEGRRAQEERENEAKAQEERRRVKAQDGHEGKEVLTTQEECVEEKKETNSMQEKDVSNRHMTWWKSAWWVRMDNGPHLRTARGRRQVWRAARRAAEQARNNDGVGETQSFAEEAEGETGGRKKWEQGRIRRQETNTLHVIFHLANATINTEAPAAAAAAATAGATMRLQ